MIVNCSTETAEKIYKILISTVVPRPIAWVSSISSTGTPNLAPFSFFNAFCASPPIVGFACGYKRGPDGIKIPKDTLSNIKDTEEFVVNIVSRHLVEKMNQTSAEYDSEVSEFIEANIESTPSRMVRPLRVRASLVNFECKLFQLVELGGSCLILGQVLCIHLDDSILNNDAIDLSVLEPVGRLGGELYTTVADRFAVPRPAAVKKTI